MIVFSVESIDNYTCDQYAWSSSSREQAPRTMNDGMKRHLQQPHRYGRWIKLSIGTEKMVEEFVDNENTHAAAHDPRPMMKPRS